MDLKVKDFLSNTIVGTVTKTKTVTTQSGKTFYTFDVAVNRYMNGNKEAIFFSCMAWDDYGLQAKDKVKVTGYANAPTKREYNGKEYTDYKFDVLAVDVLSPQETVKPAAAQAKPQSQVQEADDIDF